MTRLISIDPGKSKCGLIVADSKDKIISYARVIKSNQLIASLKTFISECQDYQVIIGNGTTSKEHIKNSDSCPDFRALRRWRTSTFAWGKSLPVRLPDRGVALKCQAYTPTLGGSRRTADRVRL